MARGGSLLSEMVLGLGLLSLGRSRSTAPSPLSACWCKLLWAFPLPLAWQIRPEPVPLPACVCKPTSRSHHLLPVHPANTTRVGPFCSIVVHPTGLVRARPSQRPLTQPRTLNTGRNPPANPPTHSVRLVLLHIRPACYFSAWPPDAPSPTFLRPDRHNWFLSTPRTSIRTARP